MNNAEIIKGIELTIEGLSMIKGALSEESSVVIEDKTPKTQTVEEVTPVENNAVAGGYSVEQLEAMKYNEFKKFASSLGVKCTGTRDEIMERILSLNSDDEIEKEEVEGVADEATTEQEEVEVVTKNTKTAKGGRKLAKKTEEPTEDEFDEQARNIAEETPVEAIIVALSDVGVKATKKNCIDKLAYALREGLIEVDDDDEDEDIYDEESVATEVDEEEDEIEIEADSYFNQYDPKGYNDPDNMTDERKEAIVSKMDEILTDVSEETLTSDMITDYIENHATEEEIELLGEEFTEDEALMLYMELVKRTIDNEGEEHTDEEDPYEVGEYDMCCGHELKYSKKTKRYICEHCGTEYEA